MMAAEMSQSESAIWGMAVVLMFVVGIALGWWATRKDKDR